jgi:hypothetical protein
MKYKITIKTSEHYWEWMSFTNNISDAIQYAIKMMAAWHKLPLHELEADIQLLTYEKL